MLSDERIARVDEALKDLTDHFLRKVIDLGDGDVLQEGLLRAALVELIWRAFAEPCCDREQLAEMVQEIASALTFENRSGAFPDEVAQISARRFH